VFVLTLYKNRKNAINKRKSARLYPEAGQVSEAPSVPLLIVDMLTCLK
jgi:hypothetical protein